MSKNTIDTSRFISIEGIDGAGKSTTIDMIVKFLESKGEEVLITREPGGTKLGETLREINKTVKMNPMTETLLLFTSRKELVETVIKPALERKVWVISDRYSDSTVAYQCGAKGVPIEDVRELENIVLKDVKPELTVILDLPVTVARARLDKTGKEPDKYESEKNEFFQKVANAYKEMPKENPTRYKLIDSSKTEKHTLNQISSILENYYEEYLKKNIENRQMKFKF